MYESMFPPGFWQLMAAFLIGSGTIIYLGNLAARKWLGVKKRKLFTQNYVNDFHKKGEWIIRLVFIACYLALASMFFDSSYYGHYLLFSSIAFVLLLAAFRAIMEKNSSENPNDYLYTLFESGFALVVVVFFAALLFPEFLTF